MYRHILIATDGSELAQKGLDHGLSLARQLGSRVTILTVSEPVPSYAMGGEGGGGYLTALETYKERGRQAGAQILAMAKAAADQAGVPADTAFVEEMWPADAIVETAKAKDCSLIVMATHGRRGIRRFLLGSQTVETLTHSPVPVLVIR